MPLLQDKFDLKYINFSLFVEVLIVYFVWWNLISFKPQTRKFHLVPADAQRHQYVSELDFDLCTDVDSVVSKDVQSVFTDLVSI